VRDDGASFFAALYRQILQREARPAEIAAQLRQHLRDDKVDYDGALRSALASGEFRTRAFMTAAAHKMSAELQLPRFREAANFFSLGTHCASSWFLKQSGLKQESGPFDWIFSSVAMVGYSIEDEFRSFLNRDDYVYVADEKRKGASHGYGSIGSYVKKFGMNVVFNHHDMRIDENYDYFVRCVNRFRAAIAGPRRVVLLLLGGQNAIRPDNFDRLAHIVARKAENCFLFGIRSVPFEAASDDCSAWRVLRSDRASELIELKSYGRMGPLTFFNIVDQANLARAFEQIMSKRMPG